MLPYLKENEIVFFKKYIKNKSLLKVGQIVIFQHPFKNIRLIKRVKNVSKNSSGINNFFILKSLQFAT